MATYYVGPGGNNSNSGLSYANRKLTLTGVESVLASGDRVYVAPGVYRETLTTAVSGAGVGSIIFYFADTSGANTDGVGGLVRITGSDDDQTATRTNVIVVNNHNYRWFEGFQLDTSTGAGVTTGSGTLITFNGCRFLNMAPAVNQNNATTTLQLLRCIFVASTGSAFLTGAGSAGGHQFIANVFIGMGANFGNLIYLASFSGSVSIANNLFIGGYNQINADTGMSAGTVTVQNNIFVAAGQFAMTSAATSVITEDRNKFSSCVNARNTNVAAGANSVTEAWLPELPLFVPAVRGGIQSPDNLPWLLTLSPFDARVASTDAGAAVDDIFGITRPATNGKRSWGVVQVPRQQRETAITYNSSPASLRLLDAGSTQFVIPVTNVSTTISVRVYRSANYTGTLPQLIIRQPEESPRTTTDTGSSAAWNLLTDTFTPAATTPYVIVELVSNNTATSGTYDVYFDDLKVQ